MINFFRKTRKKLADDNKFLKYSRYAIGEIVLVVVGILIALQINNWNEDQKIRILERETLTEILENITGIESDLVETLERIKFVNLHTDSILTLIETQVTKPKVLERTLHLALIQSTSNIKIKKIGYETLKNRGIDIVENKELKNGILNLYEDSYVRMTRSFNWEIDDNTREYMLKNFSPSPGGDKIIYSPYNYDFVISDNYFNSLIRTVLLQRLYFQAIISSVLEDTRKTKDLFSKELNIKNPKLGT